MLCSGCKSSPASLPSQVLPPGSFKGLNDHLNLYAHGPLNMRATVEITVAFTKSGGSLGIFSQFFFSRSCFASLFGLGFSYLEPPSG